MKTAIHLRPTGFLHGADARRAAAEGRAGPLGAGPVAYTLAEIIEGPPGRSRSRFTSWADLAASADNDLQALRRRIEAPRALDLADGRVRIMGIVNVTPDSFSDGGLFAAAEAAIAHGRSLIEAGADIVDVGGESTRPGSEGISLQEELDRVMPVIEGIVGHGVPVSIDTRKAAVMEAAVNAGAAVINDVTALTHEADALATAARLGVPVVLMHMAGTPETMQDNPHYDDVVLEVFDYLEARIAACEAAGIPRERLMADPGIGFGKTFTHNLQLLDATSILHGLGCGLVVGASRKGFIGKISGEKTAGWRAPGSIAAALAAVAQGAQVVRVHDVAETVQAVSVWQTVGEGTLPA